MAIVTIEDILKRKKYMETKKDEIIEIDVEGFGTMKFKACSIETYLDVLDSSSKDKDSELLYYCSVEPNFRDESLINALGCKSEPYSVPSKFLSKMEINEISRILIEKSGITEGAKIIVKN